MAETFKVKCLDSVYDAEKGWLVLNCFVLVLNQPRIFIMQKSDFHYKDPNNPVPDYEMYKTADLFKNKEFNMRIDDPLVNRHTPEDYQKYEQYFRKTIGDQMEEIADGLKDESGMIQRKLGRLAEEGKLDLTKILSDELKFRNIK